MHCDSMPQLPRGPWGEYAVCWWQNTRWHTLQKCRCIACFTLLSLRKRADRRQPCCYTLKTMISLKTQ